MQLIGIIAVFLSIVWMLRDEEDRTRPVLVLALVINLFYGWLLSTVLGREDSLLSLKFDYFLFDLDRSLGISSASIALSLQGIWRVPLYVTYELMVPMMICWFPLTRHRNRDGSVVLAYVAELFVGPLVYAILPACGPIYAFGAKWLHPPMVPADAIRLKGMPNAFPSLHVGTALVFVLFARGKLWRTISLAFLVGTVLATLSTGEHYVIDLIPGLAFGCFAASVGYRRARSALFYLGLVLSWSLAIRFEYAFLIARLGLLRCFAVLTIAISVSAVCKEWLFSAMRGAGSPNQATAQPSTASAILCDPISEAHP